MGDGSIQTVIAIVLCAILSAFFSALETAYTNFNRMRMKSLASDSDKNALRVMKLVERNDALMTTILIIRTVANTLITVLFTQLFIRRLPQSGAMLSLAVAAVMVLLVCIILPKSIAREIPDKLAMSAAMLMQGLVFILTPLSFLFSRWGRLFTRLFKSAVSTSMTEDDLMTIVDEAEQDGGINESEGELIRSAIEFNDAEVADIITPRVDVVAVDKGTPPEEIAGIFRKTGFSRLPVYDDTIDDIIGILHEKDFYYRTREGADDILPILGKPIYVSCHAKISKLLTLFQQAKTHMAIVLDDYGGTMGIATLEDVLEELVGDIWDEHDEVVELFTPNEDGSVTVSGNARTLDAFDYFDIEPDDEDDDLPQTVSGWVTRFLGNFPVTGESFDYEGMHVVVTDTDGKTVEEINVRPASPVETTSDQKSE